MTNKEVKTTKESIVNKDAVAALADLLHQNNLGEIEYESNGTYIRVAVAGGATSVVPVAAPVAPAAVKVQEESKAMPAKKNTIDSPMVGVIYLRKDPNSPEFVKVGDVVSVGQVVCLIEAMKTFNPIKSPKSGRISAILVESGKPVEFGQHLFEIE